MFRARVAPARLVSGACGFSKDLKVKILALLPSPSCRYRYQITRGRRPIAEEEAESKKKEKKEKKTCPSVWLPRTTLMAAVGERPHAPTLWALVLLWAGPCGMSSTQKTSGNGNARPSSPSPLQCPPNRASRRSQAHHRQHHGLVSIAV